MNSIRKKLHSRSAETLTETLVSVLIISVVSVVLASMIATASNINAKAKEYDENLDTAVTNMETSGTENISVTVTVNGGSKGQVIFAENDPNPPKLQSGGNDLNLYRYTYTVSTD